jgi:hypothetical protein
MAITKEKFDQLKIDKLRYYLEDMASKGQARPFEIFVDSLKVIPKTVEVKEFDSYEYYMNENTEKIRILIYVSTQSPRNDQYCFYVQQAVPDKSLNGLGDIDGIIQEKLAARDREHEMKSLHTELAETKTLLKEAEEYADQLQEELNEVKQNKFKLGNINIVELAAATLESMARRNPQVVAKLPGGELLAGIIEQDTQAQKGLATATGQRETAVSFQPKPGEQQPYGQYQQYLPLLEQLDTVFDDKQFPIVIAVLGKLCDDPSHLMPVAELLNIEIS